MELGDEALAEFAPSKIFHENLFVLLRLIKNNFLEFNLVERIILNNIFLELRIPMRALSRELARRQVPGLLAAAGRSS